MAGTIVASTLSDGTNSTSTTNCIQGSAKAWVNFNGTGTVAIRGSYNVSSVTDNGTGMYTVNFTNAMSNANYSATSGIGRVYTTQSAGRSIDLYSFTTTSLSVAAFNDQTFVTDDVPYIGVAVFSS